MPKQEKRLSVVLTDWLPFRLLHTVTSESRDKGRFVGSFREKDKKVWAQSEQKSMLAPFESFLSKEMRAYMRLFTGYRK